jgi:poly(hydroxyalkanoate) depolymerase family esterase
MLHGCTQNPEDFARGTTMNEQGEAHRLIVAYPEQDRAANAQVCWNWFRPGDQGTDGESGLLAELSRELSTEFCLAEGSAFVAGLSAGGAMAAIVAQAHPASFAAAGVHSGLAPGAASDVASAFAAMSGQGLGGAAGQGTARSAPLAVPTILFHGDADRTVVPSNSDHARRGLTGVSEARRSVGGRDARVVTGRTREGRAVELWRVAGAGHAWQGGDPAGSYADRQGPDASAEMMRFFLAQLPVGARQG